MKPVICAYSNCQGEGLQRLLAQHPALSGHEMVFARAWLGEEPAPEALARCEVFIRQVSFAEPAFAAALPATARRITVPLLATSLFWPYTFDRPDDPAGWRFPYGDRNLVAKLRLGLTAEQAVDAYIAQDVPASVRLDRLLTLEQQRWRADDARCDVALSAFIEAQVLKQRLFFTPDHPTDLLLIELANRVLALLGLAPFAVPDWRTHVHALCGVEVPVHPAIVRHFALPFISAAQRYPQHGGWLELDARESWLRYATALGEPGIDHGLREAAAAIRAGDLHRALNLCALVRIRQPANRDATATLAVVSALAGHREQAAALLMDSLAPVA